MASQLAILPFIEALRNPEDPQIRESLKDVRQKLGLTDARRELVLNYRPLGRRGKTFVVYAEEAHTEQRIVVKFNPLGIKDPFIDNVYKEFRILSKLHPKLPGIVPEPLFCSSPVEERIVGTAFFVMTFIDGRIFRTIGEIRGAGCNVVNLHVEAMKKLAEVHRVVLRDRHHVIKHQVTQAFWQEIVDLYKHNYRCAIGWWKWLFWADQESYLFSEISKGRKPMSRRVRVVHGNLDIGNFVFDEKGTKVRAILNWKYEWNGDPLIDVTSLLLPFMDVGNYTGEEPLQLLYSATDTEVDEVVDEVVEAYKKHSNVEISGAGLEFAKAVCCLRQLCVVKRGVIDDFRDHELERFPEITNNPVAVIDLLRRQCEESYEVFRDNMDRKVTPIDGFIEALENPESSGRLDQLKQRLDPTGQGLKLSYRCRGKRGKVYIVYAEGAPKEQGVVVKINPLGIKDPFIDDVYKEYRILKKLHPKLPGIVPEPLFCSSAADAQMVGAEFIVRSFIDGHVFRSVGDIQKAGGNVVQMHVAAMRKLAEVHGEVLHSGQLTLKHKVTQPYWQEVVSSCKQKYRSTVGWWRWLLGRDPESSLFSEMSNGRKPMSRRVSVVHGSLGIENFVFNDKMTEVRAILNWKYEDNGDPLIDVASLLLPFMDVETNTIQERVQLLYQATDAEVREVVTAYRHSSVRAFNNEELEFAKAVCCLRQICAVKRGIYDRFENSEFGGYPEVIKNSATVINLLHIHGEESYREFRC